MIEHVFDYVVDYVVEFIIEYVIEHLFDWMTVFVQITLIFSGEKVVCLVGWYLRVSNILYWTVFRGQDIWYLIGV